MDRVGLHADELWDEADGFFYDLLRLPDGQALRLKVRSLVGLIPLIATTVIEAWVLERLPVFRRQIEEFQAQHPHLFANVSDPTKPGVNGRRLIALVNETKLRRILGRMLDESRFFSDYGIRSLSRYHLEHPYRFQVGYHPELCRRLIAIFERNAQGQRPVYGGSEKFQNDPYWRDLISFYEYFHGDNGSGVGASHQTGWTAMVARLIQFQQAATAEMILAQGFKPGIE